MPHDMTQERMLAQLSELVQEQDHPEEGDGEPGATARELAEAMGYHCGLPHSVGRRLQAAIAAGTVLVGKGVRTNMVGVSYRPPVYRPSDSCNKSEDLLQEIETSQTSQTSQLG